jgi:hypothetical protein
MILDQTQSQTIAFHSGIWKGQLTEGTSSREATYDFRFRQDPFSVGGTGPEGCTLQGFAIPSSTMSNELTLTWTEIHSWGKITMTVGAFLDEMPLRFSGNFVASDGGRGKIELRFVRKMAAWQ